MERQQGRDRKEGWTIVLRMPDLLEEGWSEGRGKKASVLSGFHKTKEGGRDVGLELAGNERQAVGELPGHLHL